MTESQSVAAPRTPLERLLRWMQGADLLERHEEAGTALTLWFRTDDAYFTGEEVISRLTISSAFSLLFRGGYDDLTFHFTFKGRSVRVRVAKEPYCQFFKCTAVQMGQFASQAQLWDGSPMATVTEARQWEFFLQFSDYNK